MPHAHSQQPHRKACKECRRLRLGCDRDVPCYNCKRRGCSAICPDGTLEKGARSRSTIIVELQETISELRARNYQLEEALRNHLHTTLPPDPPPPPQQWLITAEQSQPQSQPQPQPVPDAVPVPQEQVLDALGTFSLVRDDGEFSVYGPTAVSEYLVRENPRFLLPNPTMTTMTQEPETPMSLPADIVLLSALFPFPPHPLPPERIDDLVPHLPPFERATTLANYYYTHFAWCHDPVPQSYFAAYVLPECYPASDDDRPDRRQPAKTLRHTSPHLVSILFMVLALGALAADDHPASKQQQQHTPFVAAEEYHTLARACLCIQPVYERPTLWAVQSMVIMMFYHMCTERRSAGYTLALWSVLGRLCEMLGLNHDQRKLKKGRPGCSELRERVFWEAMNLDSWQAFTSGRAKALSFKAVTCRRPEDYERASGGGWTTWKHAFTTTLDSIAERLFREGGCTYSQVRLAEKTLREVDPPSTGSPVVWGQQLQAQAQVQVQVQATLQAQAQQPQPIVVVDASVNAGEQPLPASAGSGSGMGQDASASASARALRSYLAFASVETALLHLHRSFFLQALRESTPAQGSPFEHHAYAESVRTVVRTAHALVEGLAAVYASQPGVVARFRPFWTHVYSAGVALGSLVVSCPLLPEAYPALTTLDLACELFQATAANRVAPWSWQSLEIMLKLRDDAHRAWAEQRQPAGGSSSAAAAGAAAYFDDFGSLALGTGLGVWTSGLQQSNVRNSNSSGNSASTSTSTSSISSPWSWSSSLATTPSTQQLSPCSWDGGSAC